MRTLPNIIIITTITITTPLNYWNRLSTKITRPLLLPNTKIRRMATKPVLASTYDASQASSDIVSLLKHSSSSPSPGTGKWNMSSTNQGIERTFKFKGFKKCWEFMNVVAAECVVQKHHPEWSNVYNTTHICWTTHSPPGLSEKDVLMARFCDEKARELGEVQGPDEDVKGGKLRELVDVVVEGGDCCVPKGK
ncbi:transcriptional coactivator/pterin dehydratase [Calycina marina]|uniref:4a-hydroxytetrahydrobiopterin dehydratase n=1 Tax=Calycina marina TaxID=1763456 RepID=A0A9P8CFB1_9HELO|nr:transcriptional coactivator/pterin dehydratase [Calycina marina]